MALSYWKGQDRHERNTYSKYELKISNSKNVMANVQNKVKGHGEGHTFKINGSIEKALS